MKKKVIARDTVVKSFSFDSNTPLSKIIPNYLPNYLEH